MPRQSRLTTSFQNFSNQKGNESVSGFAGAVKKVQNIIYSVKLRVMEAISSKAEATFETFPGPVQTVLRKAKRILSRFLAGLWEFMNPPLWAMLIAIIVASVPALQHLFFDEGTFIRNSVTRAIAVPLILVVLGGMF